MIPVNKPLFISDEKKYLNECIDSGWISSEGPFVVQFEKDFAKYVGRKYGVAVSSGTSALEVAVGCLELKKGDEVIIPSFTIMSCALAVVNYGAIPVFVDSEPDTWNIDVNKIEAKITKKTKAIMIVHIYGHPCDMDKILKIAKKYNLKIIEDAAEAHGAEYKSKKCGSFGDISCFSFYANKIISTGEGGIILTNKKNYFEKAKSLRNLGFGKKQRFLHQDLARNYRMTNLQAGIGLAQLKNIDKLIKIKRDNAKKYTELLKNVKGLQLPVEKNYAKNVYWMYGIVLDKLTGFTAEKFAEKLAEKGIQTRPFFYSLHLQTIWKSKRIKVKSAKCPISERIEKYGLYLPSGLGLLNDEIIKIYDIIKELLSSKKNKYD